MSQIGRKVVFLSVGLFVIVLGIAGTISCSKPNAQAPAPGRIHPDRYLLEHAGEATADLTRCQSCHRADLTGTQTVPNCFSCHEKGTNFKRHDLPYIQPEQHGAAARNHQAACLACHGTAPNRFDGGIVADENLFAKPNGNCSASACHPAAGAHPTHWQGSNDTDTDGYRASHRVVTQAAIETSCALCHRVDGGGPGPVADAPSCFNATFTNRDGSTSGCHAGGPGRAAHDLPYDAAELHGDSAKADLASCQTCHGTPDTTDFDGGLSAVSCATATCHPAAGAHPTRWQGENDISGDYISSHRDAANATTGCAICHDVTDDRTPPSAAAPSCFSATFTNSDGSTNGCHRLGPGTVPHALPYTDPVQHGADAKADLKGCQACHGTPNTTAFDGGIALTSCTTFECHPDAGAHPTHWQGENDPTGDYTSSHRNAGQQPTNCSICHDYTKGRKAPLDQAPSCFNAGFTNRDGSTSSCHGAGPGATHALPFTDPGLHGPEAKTDLRSCVACHATPADAGAGDNPRFNLPVGDLAQGCETSGCHRPFTAHPVPLWAGAQATSHATAGMPDQACALCHGSGLGGSIIAPACASCHEQGSPLFQKACTSCHANPPDDPGITVADRPNRDGAHGAHQGFRGVNDKCAVCHTGAGTNADNHFDTTTPATIKLVSTYDAKSGAARFNEGDGTCSSTRCHGGRTSPNWYHGRLDVATDCQSCHRRGTAQFNGYHSGLHKKHVRDEDVACVACHDASIVSDPNGAHLSNLATPDFEQDPVDTLRPLNQSCRASNCHEDGKNYDLSDWFD